MMLQNVAHWLAVLVVKFQYKTYKFTVHFTVMLTLGNQLGWPIITLYTLTCLSYSLLGDPIFTKRRRQVSQQGIAWHSHVVAISATGRFFFALL